MWMLRTEPRSFVSAAHALKPLRMSSVPFQHCRIIVTFMLATNTMRGGEGSFTPARWGRRLGLLFLEFFGGAFCVPGVHYGKTTRYQDLVPAPTGTWSGHSDSLCVVQKHSGKMELNEVQK